MKKSLKIMVLLMLMVSSGFFGLRIGLVRGLILMGVSLLGIFRLEKREVERMVAYFEPLLFRCGRVEYVEESLQLLRNSLLFKSFHDKRLLYLTAGVYNVKGQYNEATEVIESMVENVATCGDQGVLTEWQYARLKQGHHLLIEERQGGYRRDLCRCIALINGGDYKAARDGLHKLREQETGNVIFREVNMLLSQLYQEINQEEADYYKMIADSFYEI